MTGKIFILSYCIKPKRWHEIIEYTSLSKTTMANHLTQLRNMDLISQELGYYQTTDKGIIWVKDEIRNKINELEEIYKEVIKNGW